MKKIILLMTILFVHCLFATTVYEDAEDGSTSRWTSSKGTVTNEVDADKSSRVIVLDGRKKRSSYLLGAKRDSSEAWNNSSDKNISWSMKFNESFEISVFVKSKNGNKILTYSDKNSRRKSRRGKKKIHFNISSEFQKNQWQTFTRDLEADLKTSESSNELISVYGFMVRGSGRVDDIKMGEDTPPATTAMVTGQIVDTNGIVIPNVTVQVFQNGNQVAFSDTNGLFSFILPANEDFSLQFTSIGYSVQAKTVQSPNVGQHISLDIVMVARGVSQNFQADAPVVLSGQDGAKVDIGANAFVDGNGNPVAGQIVATITPVDVSTRLGIDAFPGNFAGVATGANEPTPIASYGVVEYKFRDSSGNELQLAQGETATVELPIFVTKHPDGSDIQVGDTIPLWYLDEDTSMWVQDGTGVVVASASSPTGFAMRATVSHFTWWNVDWPLNQRAGVIATVTGPDSGTATIIANTSTFSWSSATTTATVGVPTSTLWIPAGTEVCFQANVSFDTMGTATTEEKCVTVSAGDVEPITLPVPNDEGLNIIATNTPVNTEVGEAPARIRILPTTAEVGVTYTTDPMTCQLPVGVTMQSASATSAVILGTPLEVGTFNCRVTGEDSAGNTATVDIEYNVTPSPVIPAWTKKITNYGKFEDVVVDVEGFSYAVGYKDGWEFCEEEDIYIETVATVAKFSPDGTLLEEWTSDCNTNRKLHGVTLDNQGNIYAVGYKYDGYYDEGMNGEGSELNILGDGDGIAMETLLVKLNSSNLDFIYERNLNDNINNDGLILNSVAYSTNNTPTTEDDKIYAVGQIIEGVIGGYYGGDLREIETISSSLVVSYAPNGILLYDTLTNGNFVPNTALFDLVLDYSGAIWAVGSTVNGDNVNYDALLVSIDPANGFELPWSRELFGLPDSDSRFDGIDIGPFYENRFNGQTHQNVYMSGTNVAPNLDYAIDTLVAGYDTQTGSTLWTKTFGGGSADRLFDMKYSWNMGTLYTVGYSYSSDGDITNGNSGGSDALLIRIDPISGDKIWDKTIGTAEYEEFKGVALDNAGGIYMVGTANDQPWIQKVIE